METKKLTPDIVKRLKAKYGTYTAAAEALGITYARWRELIRKQQNLTRRLVIIIDSILGQK